MHIRTEAQKARRHQWEVDNAQRIRKQTYEWQAANPEKVREATRKWKAANRDKARRWAAANLERARVSARKYRAANREKVHECYRQWAAANPEQKRALNQKRRSRKAGDGGSFTAGEWQAICEQHDYRCLCCGEQKPLTVDHIIPVGQPGSTSNISNIQPLCQPCNSSKGTKTIDYRQLDMARSL